jgi:lipoprotein-anchoring transpeptidase ErfK/SrfK
VKRSTRLTVALAAATLAGLLSAGLGASHRNKPATASAGFGALRAAPAPALRIGRPQGLSARRYVSRWTVVRHASVAHARPSASSTVVAKLATSAPEGTPNLLTVLRARPGADGRLWVEVRLPTLPNGSVGWVPRRSLGSYEAVETRLVVDRARLRATLYRAGRIVFGASVGVGTDAWPTPAGEFTVRSELTRYASPFYGPIAFGTTARSAVLTDWPDGGFVGIHGTNEPGLIPGRVSHGCIRLRNRDLLRLAALMPIGTPVTIR